MGGEEEGQAPGSGGHSIVEVKYARTGPGRNRKIHNNEILVVLWDVCGTSLAGPLGRIQGLVWADKMEWNAIRETWHLDPCGRDGHARHDT